MKKLIPNPQSLIPEKDILVYQGEAGVKMTVKTDGETVWLTQEQMCQLFGRERSVITKHIRNIFKEGELPQEGFVQNLHITSDIGGRPVSIYNLDVVISVGYRVKSIEGTRFRQWATRVLREMLLNRLEEVKRIGNLERRTDALENDVKHIKGGMDYLFKQVTTPDEPPRRRIGFGADENDMPRKPYARLEGMGNRE